MDLASRARIKKGLDSGRIMEWQKKAWRDKEAGQNDLFSSETSSSLLPLELEEAEPWTLMEALEAERQSAGFYLSGHPLDWLEPWRDYADLIRKNNERYGSYLLNRPEQATKGARQNAYKSR